MVRGRRRRRFRCLPRNQRWSTNPWLESFLAGSVRACTDTRAPRTRDCLILSCTVTRNVCRTSSVDPAVPFPPGAGCAVTRNIPVRADDGKMLCCLMLIISGCSQAKELRFVNPITPVCCECILQYKSLPPKTTLLYRIICLTHGLQTVTGNQTVGVHPYSRTYSVNKGHWNITGKRADTFSQNNILLVSLCGKLLLIYYNYNYYINTGMASLIALSTTTF